MPRNRVGIILHKERMILSCRIRVKKLRIVMIDKAGTVLRSPRIVLRYVRMVPHKGSKARPLLVKTTSP